VIVRTVRRLSSLLFASVGDSTAASSGGDSALVDLQRQLSELEKTRVKDRQELLDKIASQKKDFDAELQDMKKRNNQV
jgi:prefoldin subunit 5